MTAKSKEIKIMSISDIITNSSSEVFLIDINDNYKDFMSSLDYVKNDISELIKENMHEFNNLNDVKEYIDNGGEFNDLSIFPRDRDNLKYYDDMIFDYYIKHSENPTDEKKNTMWTKSKKSYRDLVGKAMIIIDDIDDDVIQNKDVRDQVFDKINNSNMTFNLGYAG